MVHTIFHSIAAHPIISTMVGFAVYNAAVQALEEPDEKSGKGYRFIYRFTHLLAYNFKYALQKKFPDYVPDDVTLKPKV